MNLDFCSIQNVTEDLFTVSSQYRMSSKWVEWFKRPKVCTVWQTGHAFKLCIKEVCGLHTIQLAIVLN